MARSKKPAASSAREKTRAKKAKAAESFLLMIGEEGAIFVHLQNGAVKERLFSASPAAPETQAFADRAAGAPSVPLLIVLDTLDQAYVTQTLPPVSQLGVKKMMARRLDREFSGNFIKGALLLGRAEEGRKDWQFLMAAVERTGTLAQWLALAIEWPNPCPGVHLLPMESVDIVARLRTALDPQGKTDAWQLLVSYNKISGLRQVVCHNNQLVLTRLGQLTVDSTPETIAGTIEQEVIGTKEYLRRLAADEDQPLDVFVIVTDEVRRYIDPNRLQARRGYLMTPHQAATVLGLEGATQPQDRYGDVALLSALGSQPKHRMTLLTSEIERFRLFYRMILGQRVATVLIALLLLGLTGVSAFNAVDYWQGASGLEDRLTHHQTELKQMQADAVKQSGDFEKVISVVKLYQRLQDESYDPAPLLIRLGELLPDSVRVKELSWEVADSTADAKEVKKAAGAPGTLDATFTLEFDRGLALNRVALQQQVVDTLNKIKAGMPGYDVKYQSMPEMLTDNKPIDVSLGEGDTAKKELPPAPIAKLEIKGPWKPQEKPAATNASAAPSTTSPPAEVPHAAAR